MHSYFDLQKHFTLSDNEFKKQFLTCKLNPEIFSHEAHLRLVWININTYGIEQAEINIHSQILNFVEFVGAKDKYHITLTTVAIKVVYHFMLKSKSNNFKEFLKAFPQLKENFKELINRHYSFNIFSSNKAKTTFLKPDVLPFN